MLINPVSFGASQVVSKPIKCEFKKGENNSNSCKFTYDDGAEWTLSYKDGKITKSGHVGGGRIGACNGIEITTKEANDFFTKEMEKLFPDNAPSPDRFL